MKNPFALRLSSAASVELRYAQLFLLTLLPMLFVTWQSHHRIDHELTEIALSRPQSVAQPSAIALHEKFSRLIDVGTVLAGRVRFRELVAEKKWDEAIEILKAVPIALPYIDRIFLTNLEGTLQADTPPLPGVIGKNFAFRDWYRKVSQDWKPYVSEVYKRAAEPRYNVIAVAIPVRLDKGTLVGILVMQIRLETLLGWSKEAVVGEKGFVYFADDKGHLAAHPDFLPQGEIRDFSSVSVVQKALLGEHGVAVEPLLPHGEKYVLAYEPVPDYGWGVVAQQPASEAFAARNKALASLLAVNGFVLLLSFLVAYIIAANFKALQEREQALTKALAEVRKSHEDLKSLQMHLVEMAKMESVGKLAAGVAHEVKNPLAVTLLGVEYLSNHLPPDAGKTALILEDIVQAVHKADSVVKGLLDFSAPKKLDLEDADLNLVIEQSLRLVKHGLDVSHVALSKELADLPLMPLDKNKIEQVFVNLFMNAVDAMSPRGGALSVKTSLKDLETTDLADLHSGRSRFKPGETAVVVRVEDAGPGVPKEYLEKIFDPFFTTKSPGKGTGLGLAVTRTIVEMHGGAVDIGNREKGGACVTLLFKIKGEKNG